jgi:hypothetical protein
MSKKNKDYWYRCDTHRDDDLETFTHKPLSGECDVCGEKATSFGPMPRMYFSLAQDPTSFDVDPESGVYE